MRFPSGYPSVTASASREYSSTYAASKAIDGSTSTDWGYERWAPGDWWRATWLSPVTVDRIKLYPRNIGCDNFGHGRIRFSDGSIVAFDVRGQTASTPVTVDFAAKEGIVWFETVSDGGAGNCSPGLVEVQAFNTVVSTTVNLLRPTGGATYSASAHSGSNDASKAADGSTSSSWTKSGYTAGMWWRVDWSVAQAVDRAILVPKAVSCDNLGYGTIHFSDSSTVAFDVRGQTTATPVTVNFTRKTGITWMKIVSDGGGGTCNPGLMEAEAYDTAPPPTASIPDLDAASDSPLLHAVSGTVVVRPDGDALISNTTFSSGSTGWDLINEVIGDHNSYVKPNANGYAYFSFAASGLAGDTPIAGVTIRSNVANPAVASTATLAVRQGSTGDIDVVGTFLQNVGMDQSLSLAVTPWAGLPWTVADVDDLEVGVIGPGTFANLRLRQMWLEVTYLSRSPVGYDADNVTYDPEPSFSGTVESGATSVDLYVDGSLAGTDNSVGSGDWTIPAGTLSDGPHQVWVEAHSAAGTTETPYGAVVIERTLDAALTPESDSGPLNPVARTLTVRPTSDVALSGDVVLSAGSTAWNLVDEYMNRTADNAHIRNGAAVFGFPDPGLDVAVMIDAVQIEARVRNVAPAGTGAVVVRNPATGTDHSVGAIGQNAGTISVTLTTRPWDSLPWTPADIDALAVGASCACSSFPKLRLDQLWVEIDYQNPEAGAHGSDGITSVANPTVVGTAPYGADHVEILDGASVVGADASAADGEWSIEVDALSEGAHSLEAIAYDASDNVIGSATPIELTIDTTAPSAPSQPDLQASSDTGNSSTDNITTDTTPEFDGTVTGDGVQVELYAGDTRVGTDTTIGGGTWNITSSSLQPAEYAMTARATDIAGNQAASSALTVSYFGSLVHLKAYAAPYGDVGGVSFISVVVQDETGQPVDDYTGTITLTSNDPSVAWPDGNTFAMSPALGTTGHTFRAVLGTTGSRTVTASAAGAVSGTTGAIAVGDTSLEIEVAATGNSNVPLAVRVVPRRADGTVARQYRGLVTLTSSAQSTNFGPEVNGQGQYQFECGCGDGHTFGVVIPSNGSKTISVSDAYGNSDQATVEISSAPSTGSDPITAATAVRWDFGNRSEFYINASAHVRLIAVEDMSQANQPLRRTPLGGLLAAGYQSLAVDASRGGHIVAGDWIDVSYERLWYANSDGRVFSRNVSIEERFSDVPSSSSYDMIDPGHPVQGWDVIDRTREVTTLEITAYEPFVITDVAYSYQGTVWQLAPGEYHVPAGTSAIDISNDAAACYIGSYQSNDHIKLEIEGFGNGRQGRLTQLYIMTSDPPYSGSCSSDPAPGPVTSWFGDVEEAIRRAAERDWITVGDPIDVSDGYLQGPIIDFSIGGLEPALTFTRTYDGEDAEAANVAPTDTLLGPGWHSNLDWEIEEFLVDPDGVLIRGADGGALVFLETGSGYEGVGGIPFTFSAITGGYKLERLDRSGMRFDSNGRLAALFDRTGREMTLSYDGSGNLLSFTDAAARTANVTLDGSGHITEIELPDGRTVEYAYDAAGRLVSATDLAGKEMEYVLDNRGRVTRIKDHADATVLHNLYDGEGRVVRQTDGAGNQTWLAIDADRGATQAFDPLGNLTTYCVDQNARMYTTFDAADGRRAIDYDASGHPRSITDELGQVTTMTSDPLGRLQAITDPLSQQTVFDYDQGDLVEVVDAEGRTIDVSYDSNDLPSGVTISEGANSQQLVGYTYDANDQVDEITVAGGATTSLTYDADGYLAAVLDTTGGSTTFTSDARGFVTTIVDPLGNESGGTPSAHDWLYTYDAMGRMTSGADPTGASFARTYDHMGRLATATDAAGVVTTFAYDGAGRLVSESAQGTSGPAAVTEYEYDAAGNLTAIVDAEERRTEFVYDALGRLVETIDADGESWLTEYDAKGRVISTTDPTGREITFEYDAADRLVSRTDAGGDETAYEYDSAGRLIETTDPTLETTEYDYDWLGRLTTVTDPLSNVTTFGYDSANDLVSMTNAHNESTSYEYDDAHRLTEVVDALLGETTYVYDVAGRLISRENARGYTETYDYDAAGRPTETTDPLTNIWQTVYDAAGRVDHTIDAESQQTDFEYDPLGRLVTISPAAGSDITFTYDLTDRRLSMADGNGTTSYEYDPIGRLTETSRGGRTVGYQYDDAGRLAGVDYPASLGSVALAYDAEGLLEEVTDWSSRVTTFGYDDLDRVTSIERPGDLLSSLAYDELGRVTSIEHAYDGTPVLELGYTYDGVGNVATRTDDQGTATFTYDGP